MNDAVKYFQKNGLQRSRELVEMGFGFCSLEDGLSFHTEQLKQLVESYEVIDQFGGLEDATKVCIQLYCKGEDISKLKQAIADVESCMEVSSESN